MGSTPASGLRTFLIADVRGFTRYTQAHGDAAAARLAGRFASLGRTAVLGQGGEVVGQRGDEIVGVFDSARAAIRAGVELQLLLGAERALNGGLPITAGIGLDAGEAEAVGEAYASGALNVAARLCALARPGQVLATDTVTTLAGHIDGIDVVSRRPLRLKGLDHAVRVSELRPEPEPKPPPGPGPPGRSDRRRRRSVEAAAVVLTAAVVAIAVHGLLSSASTGVRDVRAVSGRNAVVVIDPARRSIVARHGTAFPATGLAAARHVVWVASPDGSMLALDASGRVERRVGLRADPDVIPAGVTATNGVAWVADSGGNTVFQIGSARRVRSVDVGNGPTALAVGGRALWVANTTDATVSEIVAGRTVRTIPVGADPVAIAAGLRRIWVADEGSSEVSTIDPASPGLPPSPVELARGSGPCAVAVGSNAVWVAGRHDGSVDRISGPNSIPRRFVVGGEPDGIAVTPDGSVWVANAIAPGTLLQLTPTGRRIARYELGDRITAIAAVGPRVWVAVAGGARRHVGGTLQVATTGSAATVDPALAGDTWSRQLLSLTNLGLVAFRRAAGSSGLTLVPGLATSVPERVGNTYTATLRRGIEYSDGTPVRASDFRRALERLFGIDPGRASLYAGLQGGKGCEAHPHNCHLNPGVVADDRRGKVVFALDRPDPDFLEKLALPYADPVPPGTSTAAVTVGSPLPATGPYRFIPGGSPTSLELVRNSHFQGGGPWQGGARGYPDRIDWRGGMTASRVSASGADVKHIDVTPTDAATLAGLDRTALGPRLHVDRLPATVYAYFDTRHDTSTRFSSVRLRRAVNDAVDRAAAARALGGMWAALPTCRVLPIGVPGAAVPCPYTVGDTRTGWHGPAVGRAHGEIRSSEVGTALQEPLVIAATNDQRRVARVLERAMQKIGIATVTTASAPPDPEVGLGRRVAAYPSPIYFEKHALSCQAARTGQDPAQFCARQISRSMDLAATTANNHASLRWRGIDSRIASQAPWVPLVNPTWVDITSVRVGDYRYNPELGVLLDQLWVR